MLYQIRLGTKRSRKAAKDSEDQLCDGHCQIWHRSVRMTGALPSNLVITKHQIVTELQTDGMFLVTFTFQNLLILLTKLEYISMLSNDEYHFRIKYIRSDKILFWLNVGFQFWKCILLKIIIINDEIHILQTIEILD